MGYVIDRSTVSARVVVSQSDVDFVRQRTGGITIRLPGMPDQMLAAMIKRQTPAATDQLPSRTLGQQGGGQIAIDPRDNQGVKTVQKVFLFDIELPEQIRFFSVGGRVYVRFDHGREPLIRRWFRAVRQTFLKRFNV